ncbi:MAG: hypothetical protein R3C61_10815 [Bacteroidia bacterium]
MNPNAPLIHSQGNLHWGILNPSAILKYHEDSVCLGKLFDGEETWWKPESPAPDGNYVIFRANNDSIEVLTDLLATRTVWYYFDSQRLIVSTSQRSIIHFLENYQPNENVYPWFLSSGTLGPGLSWDTRIQYLQGNSALTLDRKEWKINVKTHPIHFIQNHIPHSKLETFYDQTLRESVGNIKLTPQYWTMLLSGGYDSRGLCYYLPNVNQMKGLSWGKAGSILIPDSDTVVASELASQIGMDFEFLPIKNLSDQIEELIRRFLINGEGRTDKITGYMDLFFTWKYIFESGNAGIIRGDHTFDLRSAGNSFEARYNYYLLTLRDYKDLSATWVSEFPGQRIPDSLQQRENESLNAWSVRLDRMFYFPFIQTALSDLKLGYVETVNPYINRQLVSILGGLPAEVHLRKAVFKELIRKKYPKVPFASSQALATEESFANQPKVSRYILEYLQSVSGNEIFDHSMKQMLISPIQQSARDTSHTWLYQFRRNLRKKISPQIIKSVKKPIEKARTDFALLGMRMLLIEKMSQLLQEDAVHFRKTISDKTNYEQTV